MLEKIQKELEDNISQVHEVNARLGEICKSQYDLLLLTDPTYEDMVSLNNDVKFIIQVYQKEEQI